MEWLTLWGQAWLPEAGYSFSLTSGAFLLSFGVLAVLLGLLQGWARLRAGLLLAFSLAFFWRLGGWMVLVMLATGTLDYAVGRALFRVRTAWLCSLLVALSLGANLGLLLYFKYTGFLGELVQQAGGSWAAPEVLLPVISLSFYSFRSLSYVLDAYHETLEAPETRWDHYLLYVSFFPTVLAGPIHRAGSFLGQLRAAAPLQAEAAGRGLYLLGTGMVKKLVIADYLGENFVQRVFDAPTMYTGLETLLAGLAYLVQLYMDFGGYTDIALGLALLCGLELSGNFLEPFKSRSLSEFWRRWHISMSSWFNDYVYVPLSLTLRGWGRWGAAVAVLVTFTLSGLWHGAGYTFLCWGLLQGLVLAVEVLTLRSRRKLQGRLGSRTMYALAAPLLLAFTWLSFVVFRARDMTTAGAMLAQVWYQPALELFPQWAAAYRYTGLMLLLGLLLIYLPLRWKQALQARYIRIGWAGQGLLLALLGLLIFQVRTAGGQAFVYLQF